MKFKLAVLSAVILVGIAASAALAGLAAVTSTVDNSGGMSCHTGENASAPAKGGCCK